MCFFLNLFSISSSKTIKLFQTQKLFLFQKIVKLFDTFPLFQKTNLHIIKKKEKIKQFFFFLNLSKTCDFIFAFKLKLRHFIYLVLFYFT